MSNRKFTIAPVSKLIVTTTQGSAIKAHGSLDASLNNGTYYIHFFNLADVPVDTTATTEENSLTYPLPVLHTEESPGCFDFDFTNNKSNQDSGAEFGPGFTIALSTTQYTFTEADEAMSVVALWELL